jgi:hypothetical protein
MQAPAMFLSTAAVKRCFGIAFCFREIEKCPHAKSCTDRNSDRARLSA